MSNHRGAIGELRDLEVETLPLWPGVKKGVAAVIALDEDSNSSEARLARKYGILVVPESALQATVVP